ncbi:MAG: hypothetical protein GY826_41945 [Fuerstiella sp.]|nr:hypothetical protein [Fuerstiella sp.]
MSDVNRARTAVSLVRELTLQQLELMPADSSWIFCCISADFPAQNRSRLLISGLAVQGHAGCGACEVFA